MATDYPLSMQRFRPGFVYFMGAEGTLLIKIGHSVKHPDYRLRGHQVGCPLRLVRHGWMPGNRATEQELHRRFAEYREHGEWFRLEGEIWDFCHRNLRPWVPIGTADDEYADRLAALSPPCLGPLV